MSGPSREQASACNASSDQPLIASEGVSTVASSQQASKASHSAAQSFRIASAVPLLVAATALLAAAAFSFGLPGSSGTSPPPRDPVVTVEKLDDHTTVTTATFAPRVRGNDYPEFSHDFTFRNDRDAEIVIEKTNKSCGCLTAAVDRMTLAPGDTATVSLAVKPHNLINRSGSLTLHTSTGEHHTYRLDTWCYPVVMLDDPTSSIISLGSLAPDAEMSVKRTVWVHSTAGSVPPILSCDTPSGDSRLTYSLADEGTDFFHNEKIRRRKYTLSIDLTAEKQHGLQARRLSFAPISMNDQEYTYSCDLTWSVQNPVSATPSRWIIGAGDLARNETVTKSFTVKDAAATPIKITAIDCSHPFVSAAQRSDTFETSQQLAVSVIASAVPSDAAALATVTIHFDSSRPEYLAPGLATIQLVISKKPD